MSGKPAGITLGVLVDSLTGIGGYQLAVWNGVCDAAERHGAGTITIAGGALGFSALNEFEKYRNFGYDLLTTNHVDGIVICGGTMGNAIGRKEFREFCARYGNVPMVSVGPAAEGVPVVLVDNDAGMREIVSHLVVHHGYRKIAFIRGPRGNADADRRSELFVEVLRANGLAIDPGLVYEGDFNNSSGAKAVETWLAGKRKFRAIVSSNDNMALGALEILLSAGIQVPYEVAIVGFDDIDEATSVVPALTTVRQPVYDQARKAVDLVMEMIAGRPVESETRMPPETIIRLSCGCQTSIVRSTAVAWKSLESLAGDAFSGKWREDLAGRMADACRGLHLSSLKDVFGALINAFNEEVLDGQEGIFIPLLDTLLRKSTAVKDPVELWQGAVTQLRAYFVPRIGDEGALNTASNLLHQARVLIGDMAVQLQNKGRMHIQKQTDLLLNVGHDLITNFDLDRLSDAIFNSVPLTGIRGAYFCVFEDELLQNGQARLYLAFHEGKRIPLPPGGEVFPAKNLVPERLFPRNARLAWVLEPLYFRTERLGYIIFEQGPRDGLVYESLFTQLCASLEGALLIKRTLQAEADLEKRGRNIESLVRPMLDAIGKVSAISARQSEDIRQLEIVNRESRDEITTTLKNVDKLSGVLRSTTELVGVINDLSEMVNIVAINASIEAAHAGKFGAGFTIISSQVRKLSDSTKKNAVEISSFLKSITDGIEEVVSSNMATFTTFQRLEKSIHAVVDSLAEIAGKMDDLSEGSRRILAVMSEKQAEYKA